MAVVFWPTTLAEAERQQQQLRQQVVRTDQFGEIRFVAGVDAGYEGDMAKAAVVVYAFPSLEPVEFVLRRHPAPLPYIPGFLSFREGPAVLTALDALKIRPDLLLCDGQGIAHPRRLGIASHIGVLTDLPSIGCAKSRLVGQHPELPDERGAFVPLWDHGEQIGVVLRSRVGVKPLYLSVGHRISLTSAISLTIACLTKYRLPEPIRAADSLASHGREPLIVPR